MLLDKILGVVLLLEVKDEEVLERVLKLDLAGSLNRLSFFEVEDLHLVSCKDLEPHIII